MWTWPWPKVKDPWPTCGRWRVILLVSLCSPSSCPLPTGTVCLVGFPEQPTQTQAEVSPECPELLGHHLTPLPTALSWVKALLKEPPFHSLSTPAPLDALPEGREEAAGGLGPLAGCSTPLALCPGLVAWYQ